MKTIILTAIPLNPDQSQKPTLVDDCHPLPTGNSKNKHIENMSENGKKGSTGMFNSPASKLKEEYK